MRKATARCRGDPRLPAGVRPLFTTMIGLRRDTRRAIRANFRGFPNDSRCRRITSVRGSSSQYCKRSLPLTSLLFPTETNSEIPIPRAAAWLNNSVPSPPDCDKNATLPATGVTGAKVASSRTSGRILPPSTVAAATLAICSICGAMVLYAISSSRLVAV